ncbi:MAG: four helix bundle protein [Bacteroidota bacterium]
MKVESRKPYDLEERTFQFAKKVALFCQNLKKTITNYEYARQLIRSSGSVGANYIEANEALGKRDFVMKIKTCRKESKESAYWIRLILGTNGEEPKQEASALMNEAVELKKIFSAIVEKTM